MNILPWYRLVDVAKTSSETQREEELGWSKAATWYGDDSPHLSWKCAQVTGKAGENGQDSGEVGGSSVGSRVW